MGAKIKKKPARKKKLYNLNFSRLSLFLWGTVLLILLAWFFVLGVLVGRGLLPGEFKALTDIKDQIVMLQDMVKRKDSSDIDLIKNLNKDPKFAFYEELSAKKEGAKGERSVKKRVESKGLKKRPAKKQEKPVQQVDTGGPYTLQLASLESEIKAIKMVSHLVDRGYPAFYYKKNVNGKTYFRVRCGRFKHKTKADDFASQLAKTEDINGFVTRVEE